jgi:hypothetical protein
VSESSTASTARATERAGELVVAVGSMEAEGECR